MRDACTPLPSESVARELAPIPFRYRYLAYDRFLFRNSKLCQNILDEQESSVPCGASHDEPTRQESIQACCLCDLGPHVEGQSSNPQISVMSADKNQIAREV